MKLKSALHLSLLTLFTLFIQTAHAQTFSVIYTFVGGPSDGLGPAAGVTIRGNALYGTTRAGGISCGMGQSCGTVYQLKHVGSDWVESLVYRFPTGSDGFYPIARPVFGPDGHVYGTSSQSLGIYGVVYRLTPPLSTCKTAACYWAANDVYAFTGNEDGAYPQYGDLIFDQQGNMYGTTQMGGSCCGTVFKLTRSGNAWVETTIYSFNFADGCYPENGVVMDSQGNLYGTTSSCSSTGNGSVYKLSYDAQNGWTETTLYSFTGGADGNSPYAGVILDSAGNLYGASREGTQGAAVFKLSPSGNTYTFQILANLPTCALQEGPYASLTMDAAGSLYGTTVTCGDNKLGNVFKLANVNNSWVYTSLHDFTGGDDGAYPISTVSIDSDGTLYGTASGLHNGGTVWMIKPGAPLNPSFGLSGTHEPLPHQTSLHRPPQDQTSPIRRASGAT